MNVLVLGSGGREHALCWKISKSSFLTKLYIAPGNAGTHDLAETADVKPDDFRAVKKFVIANNINCVVVGPEALLVAGIADYFAADKDLKKVILVGPNKAAARLEGSKEFAKQFMHKYNIPTAKYQSFTKETLAAGQKYLETLKPPYVLKADGLASGKGVVIVKELKEAKEELKQMLSGKFGEAGNKVVIEEFLKGTELSVFVITDGTAYKILPEAKDYKKIGEGDTGPNTGGMGAISPVPFATPEFMDKIEAQVIIPTMKGLIAEKISYKGFIFFGLMKVGNEPYVVEYNCRLGDPEAEVIIPRIKSDLLQMFEGIGFGTLSECDMQIEPRSMATVMLVSKGYPDAFEKGKNISGLDAVVGSIVFHAGTRYSGEKIVSNGGRVIAVTSFGNSLDDALDRCYHNAEVIRFAGKNYRKDIGFDLSKTPQLSKIPQKV